MIKYFRSLMGSGLLTLLMVGCVLPVHPTAGQPPAQDPGPQPTEQSAAADAPTEGVPQAAPKGINFLTLLTKGGWFMIPLAILSVVVVTISLERFLALRRERIFPPAIDRPTGRK